MHHNIPWYIVRVQNIEPCKIDARLNYTRYNYLTVQPTPPPPPLDPKPPPPSTPTHNFSCFSDYRHSVFVYLENLCFCTGASPGFGRGGGQEIFFPDLGICMSRSDMLRMAKPCAVFGGFGGMLPRKKFLKRCNLVRFRVYFDQILSLFFSKNAIFYIKNKYFRYTFVMGYFS